jgi:hypothetical protein
MHLRFRVNNERPQTLCFVSSETLEVKKRNLQGKVHGCSVNGITAVSSGRGHTLTHSHTHTHTHRHAAWTTSKRTRLVIIASPSVAVAPLEAQSVAVPSGWCSLPPNSAHILIINPPTHTILCEYRPNYLDQSPIWRWSNTLLTVLLSLGLFTVLWTIIHSHCVWSTVKQMLAKYKDEIIGYSKNVDCFGMLSLSQSSTGLQWRQISSAPQQ